jgi:hypothetical protein
MVKGYAVEGSPSVCAAVMIELCCNVLMRARGIHSSTVSAQFRSTSLGPTLTVDAPATLNRG